MKNISKLFRLFKNRKFKRVFILVVLVLLLSGGTFYYLKKEGRVFIDNSQIEVPIINITSEQPGILNEIDVTENQTVKKGDLLAIVGTQALRAQTEGIVIVVNKQIGSTATLQTSVVSIVNPDDFRVVGALDENKGLKDIRVGQAAAFTVDAFPGETFWGYVDEVGSTARQTQASFSISSERPVQQFNIFIRYDVNRYPQVKNGMSAKLTVYTKTN